MAPGTQGQLAAVPVDIWTSQPESKHGHRHRGSQTSQGSWRLRPCWACLHACMHADAAVRATFRRQVPVQGCALHALHLDTAKRLIVRTSCHAWTLGARVQMVHMAMNVHCCCVMTACCRARSQSAAAARPVRTADADLTCKQHYMQISTHVSAGVLPAGLETPRMHAMTSPQQVRAQMLPPVHATGLRTQTHCCSGTGLPLLQRAHLCRCLLDSLWRPRGYGCLQQLRRWCGAPRVAAGQP